MKPNDSPAELQRAPANERSLQTPESGIKAQAQGFSSLIDALPAAIYTTDAEGRLTHFNPAAVALSGRKPELGNDRWCVSWKLYYPDGRPMRHDECPMALALKGESIPYGAEAILERPDGTRIWFEPYPTALRDSEGRIVGGINMLVDVTSRRRTERLFAGQSRVLQMLARGAELYDVLAALISVIEGQSQGLTASILVRAADSDQFCLAVSPSLPTTYRNALQDVPITPPYVGPCGRAAHLGEDVAVANIAEDGRWSAAWRDLAASYGLRSCYSSPILSADGPPLGSFCVYYRELRAPEAWNQQLIRTATHIAGIALEHRLALEASRQNEEAARHSEEKLRVALAASDTGTFRWNPEADEFLDFDLKMKQLYGFFPDELVRRSGDVIARIHPDDVPAVIPAIEACRQGADFDMEHRAVLPDGTIRWIYGRAKMQSDVAGGPAYLVGAGCDVTRSRQAEESLRESEERFRSLANTIPNLAWMADKDGSIFWYNDRWYEYSGTTPEEMKGWGWQRIHDPQVLPAVLVQWRQSLVTGKAFDMTFPLRGADGCFRPFLTRVIPVRDELGRVVRWFGTNTDITDQKAMEDALRRANIDLEQFAYSASHDLQEPIRNIAIYSEMLRRRYREALDEQGQEFLNFVTAGAAKMELLVKGLLTYMQIAKSSPDEDEVNDAGVALESAISNLSLSIEKTSAEITHDSLPTVRMRQIELQQLFQNLLSNAIKYRNDKEQPRIHVGVEAHENMWQFSIRDNGIGIEPEYREVIFGIFKRLHAGSKYQGTGIGLAICQKAVERRGGRIWVESEPGQGATFYFTLPKAGAVRS